jgi:putative transposase
MTTQNTVMAVWISARKNRSIIDGFIFHSDRGVQYASNKMTNLFSFNRKITQSMSRKGNFWDNAVAESFFKTIKNEWLYRFKFNSYSQLYERIHSTLGYLSPLEMEIKLRGLLTKRLDQRKCQRNSVWLFFKKKLFCFKLTIFPQ